MAYNNVKVKARQIVNQNTQTETLGIVTNVPMGEWQAGVEYKKLNMVRSHNATYQAKKDNIGVEPTTTLGWQDVWQIVAYDGRGVVSSSISYQASVSNTEVPSGEWSIDIPDVPQGQYLWTRTIYNFTDGTQNISYSVSLQGLNFTQQDRENLDKIVDAFPSSASKNNLLATQDFVNSSINNLAAFYITSNAQGDAFPTRAALLSATTFYQGGQPRIPTQNDYAIVLADESQPKGVDGNYPTTRYSYQGGTYPNGQWDFQYVVNNTSLTQAQVDAINSGITKELVAQFSENTVIPTKNLYNLGAFDSYVSNGDGTVTITRETGYFAITPDTDMQTVTNPAGLTYYIINLPGLVNLTVGGAKNLRPNRGTAHDCWSATSYPPTGQMYYMHETTRIDLMPDDGSKDKLFEKPIVVEYHLDTAHRYTEQVIENQPIRPANQEENYYWHKEWKKGLNVFSNSQPVVVNSKNVHWSFDITETPVKENTPYTLTYSSRGSNVDQNYIVVADQNGTKITEGTARKCTFTTPNECTAIQIWWHSTRNQIIENTQTYSQIMLVEGFKPYPYEPYCGEILRENDIEKIDGSLYVKKSGDTMTGKLNAYGGISLNERTPNFERQIPYFIGIEPWTSGGTVKYRSYDEVVSDLGINLKYSPTNPQKSPYGFNYVSGDSTWGNRLGSPVTDWDIDGCTVKFRKNNPSQGKLSMLINGTVYVNEGMDEVYSPINKPRPYDIGAVPVYVIAGTGTESKYCLFARTNSSNATDNCGATLLIAGGGNFGGTITGTWLVEITNRGSTPTMTVTTIQPNNNGTVVFGYRRNGSYFEFGMYTTEYRSLIYINELKNTNVEIQTSFYDSTTAPSGWTVVRGRNLVSSEDITLNETKTGTPSFYAPTSKASFPNYHLMSNSDGVPIWVAAGENFRLYTSSSLSTGRKQISSFYQAYFKNGYTWLVIRAKPDDADAYIYYALPYSLHVNNNIIFKASTTNANKFLTISFPSSGSTEVSLIEIMNFNGFNALDIYMCKI